MNLQRKYNVSVGIDDKTKKRVAHYDRVIENSQNLPEFIDSLKSVNPKKPDVRQNETSMKDAQGKRIIFNEEHLRRKTFKGIEVPKKPYKKF